MTSGKIVFWTAALLGHGALWVEIVNRLHGLGWPRRIIDSVTVVCGLLVIGIPVAVALLAIPSSHGPPALAVGYGWACLATLAVVALTRVGLRWDPACDRQSARTNTETLDLAVRLGDAATAGGGFRRLARLPGNPVLRVAVEHHDVPLDRLPPGLEGLKIAHLTDLHMSGRLSIDYFREIVGRVNAWEPDLVCLTGDLVEHAPQLEWIGPTLGELRSRDGAYFVLGNHDAKLDCDELRRRLTAAGLVDVAGRAIVVEHAGATIRLAGNERPWFPNAPALADSELFTVCLVHTPDRFGWAVERGVDLVLAGHTHGGQVCFPVVGPLLCPSRHGVRYASGTFRRRGTVMHVGRGTGSLFPLRYGCPPEVALLTLRQA